MIRKLFLLLLLTLAVLSAAAQAPAPAVPTAAQAVPLDPIAATRAWIDTIPTAQRAKSDAYFEGGYWLLLWAALVSVASAWLLLASGVSRKLREGAERFTKRRPLQVALYAVGILLAFTLLSLPFIAPLFNDYKPLSNAQVREEVLSLARAHGVPAQEVYEFNASKQHRRISANVAGLGGTMRIALNDNLLKRSSRGEIRMVMAHEIGHYVLNHVVKGLVFIGLVIVAMFAFAPWAFAWAHARWGARWGVRDVADPAGLPILVAAFTVFQLLATPVNNTLTRVQEIEADQFGLAAGRDPDGEAAVILKLAEYRKMEPGPIEEFIFYTHPSGWPRIENAMRWKAEQQRVGAR
jgi:Zn-dependent protease with chaperone function